METDPQGPGAMALPWSSSECSSFPGKQLVQVESCPLKSWGDWGDSCLTDLKFLSLFGFTFLGTGTSKPRGLGSQEPCIVDSSQLGIDFQEQTGCQTICDKSVCKIITLKGFNY